MSDLTQERTDTTEVSAWTPLRNQVFRALFIAQFVSYVGTWMQSVAAQWFLVEGHSSATVVALVQTASLGPTLLLALFAGALADVFDQRRLLMVLQSYAVLVALALAGLTYFGRLTPTALLLFTLAIGVASAAFLGATALSVVPLGLRPETGKLSRDISRAWPTPMVVFEPCPNDGPVLVTFHYRVATDTLHDFVEAMRAVRRSRLRTGGHSWRLYHSLQHPDTVLERFTVPSWTEFERQHTERWLESDHDGVAKAVGYTLDRTRRHEYYLALRVHR